MSNTPAPITWTGPRIARRRARGGSQWLAVGSQWLAAASRPIRGRLAVGELDFAGQARGYAGVGLGRQRLEAGLLGGGKGQGVDEGG